jgi:hypothetical protein
MLTMLKKATQDFLVEWLSSTTVLVFHPSDFAAGRNRKADTVSLGKDLAFAAASVIVAVTLFQTIQRNRALWDGKRDAIPFALAEIVLWGFYAIIAARVLQFLKGSESTLMNIGVILRLFSVFYILAVLWGTLVYKALDDNAYAFYMAGIAADWLMQVIYFPVVLIGLNQLKGWTIIVFILLNLVLATARAFTAVAVAHPFGSPTPWKLNWPVRMLPPG